MQQISNSVVQSPLLGRLEAAEYLTISLRALDELVRAGKLAIIRITTRRVAFAVADLNAFLAARRTGGNV